MIKHLVKERPLQQNQKGHAKYQFKLLISKINLKHTFLDKLHALMLLSIITACQQKNIEMYHQSYYIEYFYKKEDSSYYNYNNLVRNND